MSSAVRFSISADHFQLGFQNGIRALVLERAWQGDGTAVTASQWKSAQDLVVATTSQGRLFPPLIGPLRSREEQPDQRVWHRIPTQSWLESQGSWVYRPQQQLAALDVADLLSLAIQLADDFSAESTLGLRMGSKPDGFIYAPGARLWFLPGSWLRSKRDSAEAPTLATSFLAAAFSELFAAVRLELSPGEQLEAVRSLEKELHSDKFQSAAVSAVAETLQRTRQKLQLPAVLPTPQAVPTCPNCKAVIPFDALQCPACVYSLKPLGAYRRIDQNWVAHPQLGFKRYCLLPLDQVGGRVPELGALNAQLAQTSELRVLDNRKASVQDKGDLWKRDVSVLVLSLPAGNPTHDRDGLLAELIPAARRAVQTASSTATTLASGRVLHTGLDWVRLLENDRGVCCTWKARVDPDAGFRVWWSAQPIDVSDAVPADSVCLDANQRQHVIEVQTAQEIYVAVAIERAGHSLEVKVDGPCAARPPRIPFDFAPQVPDAAVPVAVAAAVKCVCGAEVPAGRRFCPKCGKPLAKTPAATATTASAAERSVGDRQVEFIRQLERAGKSTRSLVRCDGNEFELLEMPHNSSLATCWEEFSSARQTKLSQAFPHVISEGRADGMAQVLTAVRAPNLTTWLDCCRTVPHRAALFDALPAVLHSTLSALDHLHAAGWSYGLLFPEHLAVDLASGGVQLAFPLTPLRLGQPAQVTSAPAGFVCPEYGQPDQPVTADWDFYSLGIILAWGLARRPPPESLSNASLPELNLRLFVPDLPPGWGGFFCRLLSKKPTQRFRTAAEVLHAVDHLARPATGPTAVRAAGGIHVGVTKSQLNPRNQDRICCAGPSGTLLQSARQNFAGFAPSESYSLDECRIDTPILLAVADGVSTVDSGEFAAAATCDVFEQFATREFPVNAAPLEMLTQLCDLANSRLGQNIQSAVEADVNAQRWLQSQATPSCTVAALLIAGDTAAVASAGDSRVYLLRHGLLEQLTVDGDQLSEYLRSGLELSESLLRDDFKEIVGWVGRFATQGGRILPDQPQRISASPGFWRLEFAVHTGDIYLCCTDGLSDFVDAGFIDLRQLLLESPPAEACRKLIDAANDCGGLDNIGVVVVQLEAALRPLGNT